MSKSDIIPTLDFKNTLECARSLDSKDVLSPFRQKFLIPATGSQQQIYFLGNSLGLQPTNVKAEIEKILSEWHQHGVEGFFNGAVPWINYHELLTQPLSKIVGAHAHEISVMNQLTVNLHLMMVSFYRPQGKRIKILCEAKAFPSDQYAFETHVRARGFNPGDVIIEVVPREGESCLNNEDIIAAIHDNRDELALVFFSGVNYYTGQLFDIKSITNAAHEAGAVAGFDLAHAAGNVALQLHHWDVDFACWCSYKYLNAGPGGVGGIYVHERFHTDQQLQRFGGWWGHSKAERFRMDKGFKPAPTAEGWQLSTPPILLYATQKASLDIFEEAGWDNIQAKRETLNAWLWYLLGETDECAKSNHIQFITPRNPKERGCQVSMLVLREGRKIFEELVAHNIITDWREPNVIRFAPVPLYNTFEEVWRFSSALQAILQEVF